VRTVTKRIDKLENRLGISPNQPRILVVICNAGWGLALEMDACNAILRECGFLPTRPGVSVVNFGCVPEDLNAQGLKKYLRESGAELRWRSAQMISRSLSCRLERLEELTTPSGIQHKITVTSR
jgi:hypothetical protein